MTKFSEYLQQHMDERGWKQADLVRAAGTSSKNVSVWMSKGVIPNAEGLEKIAKAFGASEDEVRRAAGEAPRTGHFQLSQERQEDADTLDREQARIVDDLIRKFAEDNRKGVGNDADGSAAISRAAGSAAEDELDEKRRRRHGWDFEYESQQEDQQAALEDDGDIGIGEIPDETT